MDKQNYIIKKIVKAGSIQEALKLEKTASVTEIYIDKPQVEDPKHPLGFHEHD